MVNREVIYKNINICETIIKQGNCIDISCLKCPLNDASEFPCGDDTMCRDAAQAYLDVHKPFEPKQGEKVLVSERVGDWKKIPRTFVIKHKGKFFCESLDGDDLCYWDHIRPLPKEKVWQWAYRSKNTDRNGIHTGEVSVHLTEKEAKLRYGDTAVKLTFTEKEE